MRPAPSDSASRAATSAFVLAALAIATLALVARVHNAFAYPPLWDFDGPGHALYVFDLIEGRFPAPGSWSSFHPPLYYALGAALWRVLPESVPVHAGLRLLSALAGFAAAALVVHSLLRRVPRADAAVVGALLVGAPVFAIATSMLGNETLCALLVTAVLVRLLSTPLAGGVLRHAALTGLLAGLAALAKSTGLGVAGVAVLTYALRLRARPRQALLAAVTVGGVTALVAAPHYVRLAIQAESLLAVISGGALSEPLARELALQPPGERHLTDYLSVPLATLRSPSKDEPGMLRSVPGLLYASTWADGHGQFLPPEEPVALRAASVVAWAGLLPTVLLGIGALRLRRGSREFAGSGPALVYAALLGLAFLVQTWVVPAYSAVKASYLLSALLPIGLLLAAGLNAVTGPARAELRAGLLAIALLGTGLTWWGWWI